MRTLKQSLILGLLAALLSSCGGGSSTGTSEGGGAFEPPGSLGPSEQITFQATRTELPANVAGVAPFIGSPFIAEIQVMVLDADGTIVPNGSTVNFSVSPVSIGALSTLDDPETDDINEFEVLLGSGGQETNSGAITLFFHAFDQTGVATITASFEDAQTEQTISNSFQIRVRNPGSAGLPRNISVQRDAQAALYVQGSGGATNTQFQIIVEDGGGTVVPDPDGFNNVLVELVGEDLSARLSGTNAAGQAVSGQSIELVTLNGVTSGSLQSGSEPGTATIRITADGADNNVSNGVTDPITTQFTIVISDGRLFSVTITSPDTNAITINRVDPSVEVTEGAGAGSFPPDPDGTYSLTVSAIASDRGGNPVLPGTQIRFGLIDAPLTGFPASGSGEFALAGGDGNPVEGRDDFFAPTGAFTTAGGGAGPGDTLVLFGDQAPPGNTDLTSARVVDMVINNETLTVARDFNLNNTTGQIVNNGPVIPYVIGRAGNGGNIEASAPTDENGVATVQLNYPVSRIGQSVIIFAQGESGESVQGQTETTADIVEIVYPGVAPAQFTVSPDLLPPNSTTDVLLCVADALGTPLQGAFIRFQVGNDQGAVVTVDGQSNGGFVQPATGADGCTVATVTSANQSPTSENIPIEFSLGELSAIVEILPPGNAALFAIPNSFTGNGSKDILLRLVNGTGEPLAGVQIGVTCSGNENGQATVIVAPGVTDANGETEATVSASVDSVDGGGTAQCTFFVTPESAGGPSAVVTFRGSDLCDFSPQPPGCGEG